tara:strand:- start:2019 stop:2549 length:531 start_codon:yes stop_codon:yes gene_type:complete
MKLKNFNILIFLIYLISSSYSYSIDEPNIKNLVIHKQAKKIDKIEFFNLNNESMFLHEFKANIVIINFWATWCVPCREEMPSLNNLKANKSYESIKFITVNIGNDSLEDIQSFFNELNINNLKIFTGKSGELAKTFKLIGLPTTIFVNQEGKEFARVIGSIDFEDVKFLDWLNRQI